MPDTDDDDDVNQSLFRSASLKDEPLTGPVEDERFLRDDESKEEMSTIRGTISGRHSLKLGLRGGHDYPTFAQQPTLDTAISDDNGLRETNSSTDVKLSTPTTNSSADIELCTPTTNSAETISNDIRGSTSETPESSVASIPASEILSAAMASADIPSSEEEDLAASAAAAAVPEEQSAAVLISERGGESTASTSEHQNAFLISEHSSDSTMSAMSASGDGGVLATERPFVDRTSSSSSEPKIIRVVRDGKGVVRVTAVHSPSLPSSSSSVCEAGSNSAVSVVGAAESDKDKDAEINAVAIPPPPPPPPPGICDTKSENSRLRIVVPSSLFATGQKTSSASSSTSSSSSSSLTGKTISLLGNRPSSDVASLAPSALSQNRPKQPTVIKVD